MQDSSRLDRQKPSIGWFFTELFRMRVPRSGTERRVFARQLESAAENLHELMGVSLFVIPPIVFFLWGSGNDRFLIAGACGVLAMIPATFFLLEAALPDDDGRKLSQQLRRQLFCALVLSVSWSFVTAGIIFYAPSDMAYMLALVQVAMVSVGLLIYMHLPICQLIFCGLITGTFVAGAVAGPHPMHPLITALAAVFLVILTHSGLKQTRRLQESVALTEELIVAKTAQHEKEMQIAHLQSEEEARSAQARASVAEERTEEAEARAREMFDLANRFRAYVDGIVKEVAGSITDMDAMVKQLSSVALKTLSDAKLVRHAVASATDASGLIATSVDEMSHSIVDITRQVGVQAEVSEDAMQIAARSGDMVAVLNREAEHISTVIQLIDSVSSQTNLLALNATIEAARAGEAGRGFAVVAEEVKGLAEKARASAEQISSQIGVMRSSMQEVVESIALTGERINGVSAIATNVATVMQQQRDATNEISTAAARAAENSVVATEKFVDLTEQIMQAGRVINEIAQSSSKLDALSRDLMAETGAFMDELRAA